jgi:HipA-like protein
MASDGTLEVYHGDHYVGRLHDVQPLGFEYAPAWQEDPEAVSLSPSLPLTQRVHVGDGVLAYFENLLPEGDLRHHLELRHHTTAVFGLLGDGSPAIPERSAPSSHILKPDIQGLRGVWGSAINETFCMQLASCSRW